MADLVKLSTGTGGALSAGATPRPEGEEARGHASGRKAPGEASPRVLTNSATGAPSTTPPQGGFSEGAPLVPVESMDGGKNAKGSSAAGGLAITAAVEGTEDDLANPVEGVEDEPGRQAVEGKEDVAEDHEIVRATTRFLIDIRKVEGLGQALRLAQRQAASGANAVLRALWRADGDSLDMIRAQGRDPARGEWPFPELNAYQLVRQVAPELASGIAATMSKIVTDKWRQVRFEALVKQTVSPPHYRSDGVLPVRAQSIQLVQAGRDFVVKLTLKAGRPEGGGSYGWTAPIVPRDARQRLALVALASGVWRQRSAVFQPDRRRPGRWYVRISYSRKVAAQTGAVEAAINRGVLCFLAMVTSTGEPWTYDGYDIEQYLKVLQHRRRRFQQSALASGRAGRGRKRLLRAIDHLSGKGERWRATRCQMIARRAAAWLADRGVSKVYIEDFSGIRNGEPAKLEGGLLTWQRIQEWPYFQLESRLRACLEELGIETVKVAPQYISQRCPACGVTDPSHTQLRARLLKCSTCGYSEHLDVAAARNVLARGASGPVRGGDDGGQGAETWMKVKDGGKGARGAGRKGAKRKGS
jgi:hypothetical protein